MNSEAPNAIGPSERAEHRVVGRAATLGAIGPLQRLQQPIPERLEIHHGGQLLQRIARLAQLRVPILKIEKSKLTRHRIPSFVQRKRSRHHAKRERFFEVSSWTGSSPTDVGRQGEQTMNAILAATANGQKRSTKKKGHPKPFQEVIASHLKTMGLIEHFSVVEVAAGSNIYQTKVKRDKGGTEALLTDVGFGVSQVLPAIVLLHYVPEGSTVIFEQPEIHLHPAVQSHLADAIIDISESRNLQFIIESHSEHLLRRLQRRVAEERLPADWIKLYFVDQVKGEARLSDIGLNDFGEIENWPEHFFGDEMGEIAATCKAGLKRRMKAPE